MRRPRLYFVEPSKVDRYHITLLDGYLRAIVSSDRLNRRFDVEIMLSESTFSCLSSGLQAQIRNDAIPVISQDLHRFVRKSLLEFWVVMRILMRARHDDVIVVTCLMPTALLMLELVNRLWKRRGFYVVVHGELETLFKPRPRGVTTFPFWAYWWFRLRSRSSSIRLAVIADFIKERLLKAFPEKLGPGQVIVLPHSMIALAAPVNDGTDVSTVCFIGYRTLNKGFPIFAGLSQRLPQIRFLAIGGGKVEDVRTSQSWDIVGEDAFLEAVSRCTVALFPYTDAYDCSLSAAVLDAMAAGVHIIATRRGCFVSLAREFGEESVTIYHDTEELVALLERPGWLAERRTGQAARRARLADSPYGLNAVRRAFEKLALTEDCQ